MEKNIEDYKTNDISLLNTSSNTLEKGVKETSINELEDKAERIVDYHKADLFMRDNEYIIRGYRINFNSPRKILKSLFMIHNETVNVWTHLIGTIFFIMMFFYTAFLIGKYWSVIEDLHINLNYLRQEMYTIKTPYSDKFHYFDNMTEKIEKSKEIMNDFISLITNRTIDYFDQIEQKLENYKKYISRNINYSESLKKIYQSFRNYSDKIIHVDLILIKDTLIKETNDALETFDSSYLEYYLNKTNMQLLMIRDNFINNLESKEMQWIDLYNSSHEKNNTNVKRWPIFIFLFGAVSCLSMSAFFHLFWVQNKNLSEILARFDYAGISLLIAGSCFPIYYYSFFCNDFFKILYLTITSTLCVSIFFFSLMKSFALPSNRKLRGTLFLCAGLSTIIPIIHLMIISDSPGFIPNQSFKLFLFGGLIYIIGAFIYMGRLPEKACPGIFCIWGSSHQIWHCLVITGILFHYMASITVYHNRINFSECPL